MAVVYRRVRFGASLHIFKTSSRWTLRCSYSAIIWISNAFHSNTKFIFLPLDGCSQQSGNVREAVTGLYFKRRNLRSFRRNSSGSRYYFENCFRYYFRCISMLKVCERRLKIIEIRLLIKRELSNGMSVQTMLRFCQIRPILFGSFRIHSKLFGSSCIYFILLGLHLTLVLHLVIRFLLFQSQTIHRKLLRGLKHPDLRETRLPKNAIYLFSCIFILP